jgi:hypothetical protein
VKTKHTKAIRRDWYAHLNANGRPKVAYLSQEAAQATADRVSAEIGHEMSVYRCWTCGGFHVGRTE